MAFWIGEVAKRVHSGSSRGVKVVQADHGITADTGVDHAPARPFRVTHRAAMYRRWPEVRVDVSTISGAFVFSEIVGHDSIDAVGEPVAMGIAFNCKLVAPGGFDFTDGEASESR